MESHPLNLAHQQHRRADAHLRKNRYDDAIQCHHNAAELLLDAMKSTTSSVALESITLQHSYHLKQKDLIKIKKEQYARVMKAIEEIKFLGKDPVEILSSNDAKVEIDIYKTINETDSLLQMLTTKEDESETIVKDVSEGKKKEKTQQIVIEELQTLSQSLHSLVEQLVFQVEVLKDENTTLKEKVNYLDKERTKYLKLCAHDSSVESNLDGSEGLNEDLAKKLPIIPDNMAEESMQPPHFFTPEK